VNNQNTVSDINQLKSELNIHQKVSIGFELFNLVNDKIG
jgi:hypothetical protein